MRLFDWLSFIGPVVVSALLLGSGGCGKVGSRQHDPATNSSGGTEDVGGATSSAGAPATTQGGVSDSEGGAGESEGGAGESEGGAGENEGGQAGATNTRPEAFTLTPVSIKTLHFEWTELAGATEYQLFEDVDGAGPAEPLLLAKLSSDTHEYDALVFLPRVIDAHYTLRICIASDCSSTRRARVLDDLAAAIGYVKASNTNAGDVFGTSVALSADGSTMIVGAPSEDSAAHTVDGDQSDNTGLESGAAYVFVRDGLRWSQQAYLKASTTLGGEQFGKQVAISADGNTVAIGALGETSKRGSTELALDSGAAFVFTRSDGSWSEQAMLKSSNSEADDQVGWSVALSADGNTLAVGALGEDSDTRGVAAGTSLANEAAQDSGAAYVFERANDVWTEQAYVKASNTGAGDLFGWSVALSADGTTLAVSARGEASSARGTSSDDSEQADDSAAFSGAVYLFVREQSTWKQQAYLKASNTDQADSFGTALALSAGGDTLAVSAINEQSLATGVDGDQADNSESVCGAVYVFVRHDASWQQQAYIKASNTADHAQFGRALTLSSTGDLLAVGAPGEDGAGSGINSDQVDEDSRRGAAYLFLRRAERWSQSAYLKASNSGVLDAFGGALALSADGGTLAVSAPQERSLATGVGGDQLDDSGGYCGALYLY
jgi:trimeric autotransporter adhesin